MRAAFYTCALGTAGTGRALRRAGTDLRRHTTIAAAPITTKTVSVTAVIGPAVKLPSSSSLPAAASAMAAWADGEADRLVVGLPVGAGDTPGLIVPDAVVLGVPNAVVLGVPDALLVDVPNAVVLVVPDAVVLGVPDALLGVLDDVPVGVPDAVLDDVPDAVLVDVLDAVLVGELLSEGVGADDGGTGNAITAERLDTCKAADESPMGWELP